MSEGEAPATLRVLDNPEAIGEHVATYLLGLIDESRASGRRFLLGCPTGRTPRPVYQALATQLAHSKADISHVTLVMMDEYLVPATHGYQNAPANAPWSTHNFVRVEIAERLNRELSRHRKLKEEEIWFPDPRNPLAYDQKIADAGGIDFFMLASGASDGHVAFNPPGSAQDSRTRIIELPETTRRDNLRTFPAFGSLAAVPTHGISVGIATITAAKEAAMLLWGESKGASLARILATDHYDPAWPATVIHECARGRILSDTAASKNHRQPIR